MLPAALSTVMTPSATFQRAGVWSLTSPIGPGCGRRTALSHPTGGALSVAPGGTTGGSGSHCSVAFGIGCGHVQTAPAMPNETARAAAVRRTNRFCMETSTIMLLTARASLRSELGRAPSGKTYLFQHFERRTVEARQAVHCRHSAHPDGLGGWCKTRLRSDRDSAQKNSLRRRSRAVAFSTRQMSSQIAVCCACESEANDLPAPWRAAASMSSHANPSSTIDAIAALLFVWRADPFVEEIDHANVRRTRRGSVGGNNQVAQ